MALWSVALAILGFLSVTVVLVVATVRDIRTQIRLHKTTLLGVAGDSLHRIFRQVRDHCLHSLEAGPIPFPQ